MNKIIIATFSNIKEEIPNDDKVIKIDLYDFKYSGKTLLNPQWPENYYRAIKVMANESDGIEKYESLKYILIDIDEQIVRELMNSKIPVIFMIPRNCISLVDDSYENIGLALERTKKYYDSCLDWMRELDMPILYVDCPIKKVLDRDSTYNYLNHLYDNVQTYRFGAEICIDDLDTAFDTTIKSDNTAHYSLVDDTHS